MEKAVSVAANLDSVVLTAKLGVAAAVVKSAYDGLSHLPDVLKVLAAAAVVGAAVALALRLALGSQQAAPEPGPAAVDEQQEAGSGSEGAATAVNGNSAENEAAVAAEMKEA